MKQPRMLEHKGGLPPGKLHRVTDYIRTHLDEGVSLHTMADLLQMSPFHFGRLFKQRTGVSPHQYLLREKIAKAKQLLTDDNLSITEISHRLGFASRAHFTTAFRKLIGATPREYRLKESK